MGNGNLNYKRFDIRKILTAKNMIWAVVIMTALFLRLYKLKHGEVFNHNDDIYYTLQSFDLFHLFDSSLFSYNALRVVFRIFAAGWGYLGFIFGFISMLIMALLKIDFTEKTLLIPYVFISLLIPFYSYKLAKALFNEKVAIISGSLIAVIPGLVAFSRTNGNQIINWALFLMTIYYFIVYFSSNNKKAKYIAPICLGLYLSNDSAFLGIFPVLLAVSLFYNHKKAHISLKSIVNGIKPFFKPRILVITFVLLFPSLITTLYLFLKGYSGAGLYGHTLSRLDSLGFYYQIIGHMLPFTGIFVFAIMLISLILLYPTFKNNMNSRILIVAIVVYSFPWLFLITPYQKQVGNYIYFIIALIILGVFCIYDFFKAGMRIPCSHYLFAFIFVITSFTAFISINNYDPHSLGSIYPVLTGRNLYPVLEGNNEFYYGELLGYNKGFKTAGYFIRENTLPGELYFSDGPIMVMRYYTGRDPVDYAFIKGYDKTDFLIDNYDKVSDKASVAIIQDKNIGIFMKRLQDDGFYYSAVVEHKAPRLHIFTRKKMDFKILDTGILDGAFDKKYGNWKSLYLVDYFKTEFY